MREPILNLMALFRAFPFLKALLAACALLGVVRAGGAQAARPPRETWTLGSRAVDVERIEGRPELIERLGSLGYEVWHFGDDWVRLSYSDERVAGWSNADGALKVVLRGGRDTTRGKTFSVGSTLDDLIRLQGTPSSFVSAPDAGLRVLRFGTAVVRVGLADDRVVSWSDDDGVLLAQGHAPSPDRGRGVPGRVTLASAPAVLRATVSFADASGDSVLDGDDEATIQAVVRNDGPGVAVGVSLVVTTDAPAMGVDIGRGAGVDSLPRGQAVTLRVRIAGSLALRDGQVALLVGIRESNGMDLDPAARVIVRTRAFHPPQVSLDGIALHDQSGNGRIEPREIVDVIARIANRGTGNARDLRAAIATGEGVVLTPERRPLGENPFPARARR